MAKAKMFPSFITALFLFLWISVAKALMISGNGTIRFYQEANYKGSLHYDISWKSSTCFNLDFHFDPRVSSLITSDCLMAYDMEDCDGSYSREPNVISIPAGEYPNLDEFLQKNYFPCTVMSFRACSDEEAGLTKPSVHLKTDSHQKYDEIDHMRGICGCTNLQVHAIGRVGSLKSGNCITLFSERNCEGKSVNIPGGSTSASRDLRIVNFKRVAKSLNLCDGSKPLACDGVNILNTDEYRSASYARTNLENHELWKSEMDVEKDEISDDFDLNMIMRRCETSKNFSCSTTCGGTLQNDSGVILYKLTESLESFERCVWIVRAPSQRSLFHVELTWSGFEPVWSRQEILVSGYFPSIFVSGLETKRLSMRTHEDFQIEGALLIITLYTNELPIGKGENVKGGFILQYSTAADSQEFPISPFSSDHQLKMGENLEYPHKSGAPGNFQRESYSANEVSSFLFLPNDKENLRTGSRNYLVEVGELNLNPDDENQWLGYQEHIATFYFRSEDWFFNTHRSIGDKSETFVNDDMILVMFHPHTNGTVGENVYFKSGAQEKDICP